MTKDGMDGVKRGVIKVNDLPEEVARILSGARGCVIPLVPNSEKPQKDPIFVIGGGPVFVVKKQELLNAVEAKGRFNAQEAFDDSIPSDFLAIPQSAILS